MTAASTSSSGIAFELVVRTAGGEVATIDLRAPDAASACALAAADGLRVIGCAPRGGGEASRSERALGIDVANFAYELAALMAAGLSVIDALRTLGAKEPNAARRAALDELGQAIREGQPLSAALARHEGRYPALLVATVRASEQTGDLSTSLHRYAEHQQAIKGLRDKVVAAAVYPMLLLVVGCGVILFLILVVVPRFAVLIESTRKELPWSSQLLMSWGRFASEHAWEVGAIGLVLIGAAGFVVRQLLRSGGRAAWLDAVPFVGPTVRKFRHTQLYRTTGMLVRGGIATPRALQLSESLLGDADRPRLAHAVRLVHEGRSLSDALVGAQLADPVAASMLTVAERTGALAEILERIAQFHESRLQRSVEMTSRLFEPALMIVIGLVVGAIVVLMYLPIFDLAASLE